MVTFTAAARAQIVALMKSEEREGLALRFGIQGRGRGGFQYRLAFVEKEGDRQPTDTLIDADGLEVLIDEASVPSLRGVTVDYVEDERGAGFKIDNPNPLWDDAKAQAIQAVLDQDINPAVAAHGGWVTLLDVKDDLAFIQMGGGCQGCGMVDVTLKQGIEVRIREAVPGIRGVIDSTDHAGGSNPYYSPAKGGGGSPFGH